MLASLVPGTTEIINITLTSNVGKNGKWVFRVDMEEVLVPICDVTSEAAVVDFVVLLLQF